MVSPKLPPLKLPFGHDDVTSTALAVMRKAHPVVRAVDTPEFEGQIVEEKLSGYTAYAEPRLNATVATADPLLSRYFPVMSANVAAGPDAPTVVFERICQSWLKDSPSSASISPLPSTSGFAARSERSSMLPMKPASAAVIPRSPRNVPILNVGAGLPCCVVPSTVTRSEEHTSELQSQS